MTRRCLCNTQLGCFWPQKAAPDSERLCPTQKAQRPETYLTFDHLRMVHLIAYTLSFHLQRHISKGFSDVKFIIYSKVLYNCLNIRCIFSLSLTELSWMNWKMTLYQEEISQRIDTVKVWQCCYSNVAGIHNWGEILIAQQIKCRFSTQQYFVSATHNKFVAHMHNIILCIANPQQMCCTNPQH